jgi:hypothetical protein
MRSRSFSRHRQQQQQQQQQNRSVLSVRTRSLIENKRKAKTGENAIVTSKHGDTLKANNNTKEMTATMEELESAQKLIESLRKMVYSKERHKYPELRKFAMKYFEDSLARNRDDFSQLSMVCLDAIEILDYYDDDDNGYDDDDDDDEFYDTARWGNEEEEEEEEERDEALNTKQSLTYAKTKEIDSMLQFVLIEALMRTSNAMQTYSRDCFEQKNVQRGRIKCEKARARAAEYIYAHAKSFKGDMRVESARVVARMAESFGISKEDYSVSSASVFQNTLEEYVETLLDIHPGSALANIVHFEMDKFTTNGRIFEVLVERGEIGLLEKFLKVLSRDRQIESVAVMLAQETHAFLRVAYKMVKKNSLYTEFPFIKKQYWESSIDKMVSKGAYEAALTHAGEEIDLQERVVASLVAAGELEYARIFAERCHFSDDFIATICSDEMMEKLKQERELRYYKLPENVIVKFVDSVESISEMYSILKSCDCIGIDTEWAAKIGNSDGDEFTEEGGGDNHSNKNKNNGDDDVMNSNLGETVALLQISSKKDCFLLDLPKILSNERSTSLLENTIGALFQDNRVLKLVFAGREDFSRLEQCALFLGKPNNVLDLQHAWRKLVEEGSRKQQQRQQRRRRNEEEEDEEDSENVIILPWLSNKEINRYQPIGLSNLCNCLFNKPLDKSCRMSDWSQRPLNQTQVAYAALDAQILCDLHEKLLELDPFAFAYYAYETAAYAASE